MPPSFACVFYTLFACFFGSMELLDFILSVVLLSIVCFGYYGEVALMKKLIKRSDEKRYGNKALTNIVSFTDEEIVVECEKDRVVLPYSCVTKIIECKDIYTVIVSKSSGAFFAKNSCENGTDSEILSFLKEKTGVSLTPNITKKSKILFAIAMMVSILISAFLIFGAVYMFF